MVCCVEKESTQSSSEDEVQCSMMMCIQSLWRIDAIVLINYSHMCIEGTEKEEQYYIR